MDNFKLILLSRDQLENLSLDKVLLNCIRNNTTPRGFLVTQCLPLLLECYAEIILNTIYRDKECVITGL